MISQSLLKLLSGNHFSIFSNSDLDLDPSDPKNNPNLPFLIRFLYTKFHVDISFLTKVIVRKRQKLTPAQRHPHYNNQVFVENLVNKKVQGPFNIVLHCSLGRRNALFSPVTVQLVKMLPFCNHSWLSQIKLKTEIVKK